MKLPKIVQTKRVQLSPWVTLSEKAVLMVPDGPIQNYHSLQVHDHTSLLALTTEKKVVLVRQYRPAIEQMTLELPGGLVEKHDQDPAERAVIEFYEETGLQANLSNIKRFSPLSPCPGRLENKLWGYFVDCVDPVPSPDFVPEVGIECVHLSLDDLDLAIESGEFINAQHLAILGMAWLKKWI